MKDRITIGGLPGSGTTTVAKLLKKKLRLPYKYAGKIFRHMAEEHGMELLEFERHCEEHPELDKKLDKILINMMIWEINIERCPV